MRNYLVVFCIAGAAPLTPAIVQGLPDLLHIWSSRTDPLALDAWVDHHLSAAKAQIDKRTASDSARRVENTVRPFDDANNELALALNETSAMVSLAVRKISMPLKSGSTSSSCPVPPRRRNIGQEHGGAAKVESVNEEVRDPVAINASFVDRSAYHRVNLAMALLLALFALSLVFDNRLPAPDKLVSRIAEEPLQTETEAEPFSSTVNNMTYRVVPVANYDLSGLVVSFHDSKTWWDYIHEAARDYVNVDDLCVVFGVDAVTGVYREVSFSNSEFSCEYEYSKPTSTPFQGDGFSNNHMLTDKPYIARALRSLRIGDQIRFSGYLVNYSNLTVSPDFYRNTSTSRNDMGPGACEVVWVTDLQVLHAAPRIWLYLRWLSVLGLIASALIWLALPYRGRPA